MSELLSKKDHYYETKFKDGEELSLEMRKECYATFACRHKFCREVCPVFREERNESFTSYGFQTTLLAVSEGLESLANVKEDFSFCLECGACELRCPTTLFAADFYRYETTTVDLVRKFRRDMVSEGNTYEGFEEVQKYIDEHMNLYHREDDELIKWAKGLNITIKE